MKSSKAPKTYVLDTNVLLHDPDSIYKFEENHVVLPVEVLEELDRFKGDPAEKGRNARYIHRQLKKLFAAKNASMTDGAKLPGGGVLSVLVNPYLNNGDVKSANLRKLTTVFPDLSKIDNRILACLVFLTDKAQGPAILVSKDINMLLKAGSLGLRAEDFLNDKVSEKIGDEAPFYEEVKVTVHELQRFASSGGLTLPPVASGGFGINDYLYLVTDEDRRLPARYMGNGVVRRLELPPHLHFPGGEPIKPKNVEQQILIDALLDPAIQLVSCYGKAGTGKTIVTTAAALHLIAEGRYDGASISRPVISLGKEIGFLPGDIQAKMMPWLQPYHDALNVIFPPHPSRALGGTERRKTAKPSRKKTAMAAVNGAPVKPYMKLIEAGLLEIEALTFIRGRSIPRRFFILDEAQQLTPHEVKTVVSRMSEGSKLILIGDPSQIDNPYVDSQSNGLVYARNRLRNTPISAHVKLMKGERSALAELAVTLM
ncbi:MAG: PhoH family protein [Opitutales bacterium]